MSPLADEAKQVLRVGGVIPAHPLALTADRALSPRHQRALTRYYLDAGAIGVAVAVHGTQFELREHGLLRTVLELAAEEIATGERARGRRVLRIAGLVGDTAGALDEARLAAELGYDLGLLSLAALPDADDERLLEHCRRVGEVLPLIGFYLQPAVGGRPLSRSFWRAFVELESVHAIKVAPFDREATLDVVEAVLESGRQDEVALYTGNDDHIVLDLVREFEHGGRRTRFVGGLLGHWSVWTRRAVELFDEIVRWRSSGAPLPMSLLRRASEVTAMNTALFDVEHRFAGCIAGIQHVLHDQGLIPSPVGLDPELALSPGQAERIAQVRRDFPHLIDDDFVDASRETWLAD